MDMLDRLRVAVTVMRAGSFSAAARQLGHRPAWVSQQMAQLEAKLGLRLFERSTRAFAATPEGRELLERIKPALQDFDDALAVDSAQAPRGTVRISLPAAFARLAVLPDLPSFQARFPGIELDLRLENRFVDLVAEGLDCTFGIGAPDDSSRIARPLLQLHPVLCAAPSYLARHGRPQCIEELDRHACIGVRSHRDGRLRDWLLGTPDGQWTALRPRGSLRVDDPALAAEAAEAGCGIAMVGPHHAAAALQSGSLQRLLPQVATRPFELSIYYARRRLLPARVRAFIDHSLHTVPLRLAQVLRGV